MTKSTEALEVQSSIDNESRARIIGANAYHAIVSVTNSEGIEYARYTAPTTLLGVKFTSKGINYFEDENTFASFENN